MAAGKDDGGRTEPYLPVVDSTVLGVAHRATWHTHFRADRRDTAVDIRAGTRDPSPPGDRRGGNHPRRDHGCEPFGPAGSRSEAGHERGTRRVTRDDEEHGGSHARGGRGV